MKYVLDIDEFEKQPKPLFMQDKNVNKRLKNKNYKGANRQWQRPIITADMMLNGLVSP